ncbi:MAG: hypothetical protein L6R41_005784 [Letrouitia leprolyta]|nr:MAG: hypothetical protein L6R41_005784 [Letrouitia leprolyta]
MPLLLRLPLSLRTPKLHPHLRPLSISPSPHSTNSPSWSGRQPSEHATNRKDELDVQSGASKSGARQRAQEDEHVGSGATSEQDPGSQNEKAKQDHPEAPGPVIGMNDERGGNGIRGRVREKMVVHGCSMAPA